MFFFWLTHWLAIYGTSLFRMENVLLSSNGASSIGYWLQAPCTQFLKKSHPFLYLFKEDLGRQNHLDKQNLLPENQNQHSICMCQHTCGSGRTLCTQGTSSCVEHYTRLMQGTQNKGGREAQMGTGHWRTSWLTKKWKSTTSLFSYIYAF